MIHLDSDHRAWRVARGDHHRLTDRATAAREAILGGTAGMFCDVMFCDHGDDLGEAA
jgi:hypothetical protein